MIYRKTGARLALLVLAFITAMMLLTRVANAATPSTLIMSHLPVATPAYCESAAEWAADPNGGPGTLAYTYVNGPQARSMFVSPAICDALLTPGDNAAFAVAVQTIYHEWMHAYFLDLDEGDAECSSLFFMRYALRHLWGLSDKVAQTDYGFAWNDHAALAAQYPQYRGTCTFPQEDPVP